MFDLGTATGWTPNYTVPQVKKSLKKVSTLPPPPRDLGPSAESLEPAIDGPPSHEGIRAYTEQMKRSSIFGNNSRTNTLSSATSSFRSHESISASTDGLSLSRKSSSRSSMSGMPSIRAERAESVQMFGRKLFSRRGRRTKDDRNASGGSLASAGEDISEEGSAKERYYGQGSSRRGTMPSAISTPFADRRTKHLISSPFNFQHLTHTKHENLPDLERSTQLQLASESSALRASQSPTQGELKGIHAQDLHFGNFSSDALATSPPEDVNSRPKSRDQRKPGVLRKSAVPPQRPTSSFAKPHNNLKASRTAPPARPPRSPMSPTCPVDLPTRISSRTASILFDQFDPFATTTTNRPETSGGFRRPAPLSLSTPPPPPRWSEQEQFSSERQMSHATSSEEKEAWPLTTASPSGIFGAELADVQEEEEEAAIRRSRVSSASGELRNSRSVPALRLRTPSQPDSPETPRILAMLPASQRPPLSPGFQMTDDSWDNAIDYAYEHEAEADCDYQWDRCSVEDDNATIGEAAVSHVESPVLDLHLEDDDRSAYHGRFRPSLLIPSALDVPELSPMSNASTTPSNPHTPSHFLQPGLVRSSSHTSSFKESHGFNLSPSLLIPSDFKSQMDQDALYAQHYCTGTTAASIFVQEPYHHFMSPVDESFSSTASYRSSSFSRGSACSSSSTRMSTTNSRGSQDSMILLRCPASTHQAHRSIGSSSSLPDMIPSILRKASDSDLSQNVSVLRLEDTDDESAPAPQVPGPSIGIGSLQHRRNKSLAAEQVRKGINHFAPVPAPAVPVDVEQSTLGPIVETSSIIAAAHGRKVSAPILSPTVREFKGRARAATISGATKKSRSSYMLFPQI